jgi:hypothetical protein
MLRISVEKNILSRGVQRLPSAQSLMLAGISLAVLSMPSFAQDTVVRKVLMTNDGITETTTTTTTSQAAPVVPVVVDQVLIPTIVPSSVDRVFVERPLRIADQTVIQRVTVPSSTTTVQKVVIDGPVFKSTITEREKALRAVIATGVADGTLTSAQADRYRAELDRLSALELSVGGATEVSYERVLPIAYEYDLLGTQLKVVNYRPLIQGNRIILSDTHIVAIDDLMNRRAGLEAKISYGLVSGKLSNSEADRLRGMLNHVAVVENSFRADGDISDKEAKDLYSEFDKVGSAIDKAI